MRVTTGDPLLTSAIITNSAKAKRIGGEVRGMPEQNLENESTQHGILFVAFFFREKGKN